MASCDCGHPASDTAAFCEQCGARLAVATAAAPVGVASGISTTAPEGMKTPGPRWAHAASDAPWAPPGGAPLGTPLGTSVAPAMTGMPGMPGTAAPSPFANGTALPHAPVPAGPAGQISLSTDAVIGIVACVGIVIGALLDWVRFVSAAHIPAPFLYDLHTRTRDPKISHVLFALAAFGVAASLIKDARRWRVCFGFFGVAMCLAYFVQVWRALSEAPGTPSYTDYVRFGPVVTLIAAGLLMISPIFGSAQQTPTPKTTDGVTFRTGRSANSSLTKAIAAAIALCVGWLAFHAFFGGDGRTLVAPPSAHYHARVHGKPQFTAKVQTVFGAKIPTYTTVAVTPSRFEEIAEDDMPAAVVAHDPKHTGSDQLAHVLMREQMLLPQQIEFSRPTTFQGKDALYEERASGHSRASILYVFDGSRVFVIAALSANSSAKPAYDALVSSFKIIG